MNVTVESKVLKSSLAFLKRIAPTNSPKPILGYCLAKATGNSLTMSATDLEIFGKVETPAHVNEPGEVLIPIAKTMKIIPAKSSVDMNGDKSDITIGDVTLSTYDPDEMPVFPDAANMTSIDNLVEIVESVKFATAISYSYYTLFGILLESDGKRLRAVATDGHILAVADTDWAGPEFRMILPRKFADILVAMKADSISGQIDFIDKKGISVSNGGQTLTSLEIAGNFPKYEPLLKVDDKVVVKSKTAELIKAVNAIAGIDESDGRTSPGVKLEIKGDRIMVSPLSSVASKGSIRVSAESTGEISVAFSANLLTEGLKRAGKNVRITINDKLKPILFEREDNRGWDFISPGIQWKCLLMGVNM